MNYRILVMALLIAGCTHTRTMMLDDRHAIISGHGSALLNQSDVMQASIIEAAKTTIGHGFRYFSVMGAQDTSRAGVFYTPQHTYASGSANAYGNSASWSGTATTTGGNAIPFVKPGMDMQIYMYRDGEVQPREGIWDAQAILNAQNK